MTTVLIPTNSVDGTCDGLIKIAGETGLKVFRWNIDLWQHYETQFDGQHFIFADPTGRAIDATDDEVVLLWRKPFTELMRFDDMPLCPADEEVAKTQMGQWLQAVVALMKAQGRVRLIEPYADRRLPKLYQLWLAREFFAVPASLFSVSAHVDKVGTQIITKPLGNPGVGEHNIFYTRHVDADQLVRPYPWFVQAALIGGHDVTCVYILGQSHLFVCDYARDEEAIDWRVEINTKNQSIWHKLSHSKTIEWEEAINLYMVRSGLYYGRLDFIIKNDTLWFLECNSNGQFGWLDDMDTLTLHRKFLAAALNPDSVV
jgi:hypothetical protein